MLKYCKKAAKRRASPPPWGVPVELSWMILGPAVNLEDPEQLSKEWKEQRIRAAEQREDDEDVAKYSSLHAYKDAGHYWSGWDGGQALRWDGQSELTTEKHCERATCTRTTWGGMRRLDWGRQPWGLRPVWSAGTNWRTSSSSVASLKPRRWTGTGRFLFRRRKATTSRAFGARELCMRIAQWEWPFIRGSNTQDKHRATLAGRKADFGIGEGRTRLLASK